MEDDYCLTCEYSETDSTDGTPCPICFSVGCEKDLNRDKAMKTNECEGHSEKMAFGEY